MSRHQNNCPNVIHGKDGQVMACHREDCSPQVGCAWTGEERAAKSTAALTMEDLRGRPILEVYDWTLSARGAA